MGQALCFISVMCRISFLYCRWSDAVLDIITCIAVIVIKYQPKQLGGLLPNSEPCRTRDMVLSSVAQIESQVSFSVPCARVCLLSLLVNIRTYAEQPSAE